MSRGTGNLPGKGGDEAKIHDNLTKISKGVLTMIMALQLIAMLLLGWKVYDPEAWLPMPPASTFLVASVLVTIFGILWIQRASYKGD